MDEKTKTCLNFVLRDLSEGIAAERCRQTFLNTVRELNNLSEDALKLIQFTEATFTIRLALCINRLMQGDDRATLRRLVKLVRPSLNKTAALELDRLLEKLRSHKNAEKIKKCRDNFIAHASLDEAARSGMPADDVVEILHEIIAFFDDFKRLTGVNVRSALNPDTVLADWYDRGDSIWPKLIPTVLKED